MTTEETKKASQKDWSPARIKFAIHEAELTLAGIAEANQLKSSSHLSRALTNSSPSGEKMIAEALQLHPKVIWPSRYFDDGERRLQGFRAIQCTAAARVRNVKRMHMAGGDSHEPPEKTTAALNRAA